MLIATSAPGIFQEREIYRRGETASTALFYSDSKATDKIMERSGIINPDPQNKRILRLRDELTRTFQAHPSGRTACLVHRPQAGVDAPGRNLIR
jgi:hypothetical protein